MATTESTRAGQEGLLEGAQRGFLLGGVALVIGWRARVVAFVLAGLTLVISLFMHDFWNMEEGMQQAHETQNFVKNLAIMAGLMCVSGMPRARD